MTVAGDAGAVGFNLLPGSALVIRPHATLGTMFPGETSGLVAGSDIISTTGSDQVDRCFIHNGLYGEDAGTTEQADDVVVYPGQGIILSLDGNTVGELRDIVFGSGAVNKIKRTRTLIPLYASWTGVPSLWMPRARCSKLCTNCSSANAPSTELPLASSSGPHTATVPTPGTMATMPPPTPVFMGNPIR